ncbi:MAG: hypothetical protein ACREDR_29570 [Blastocatellia bacterium]
MAVPGHPLPADPEYPERSLRVDNWTVAILRFWIEEFGPSEEFWPLMRRLLTQGCTLAEGGRILHECNELLDFGLSNSSAGVCVVKETLSDPPFVEVEGRTVSAPQLLGLFSQEASSDTLLAECLKHSAGAFEGVYASTA